MGDTQTVDNADEPGGDFNVSVDSTASGAVQLVKLADSTNASDAHVPADSTSGLKVDLGADNAVTVTSGTVALSAGTAEIGKLAAGVANIGLVDVNVMSALVAGTAEIGRVEISDGTTQATVSSTGGTMEGVGVVLVDADGEAVGLPPPAQHTQTLPLTTTPLIDGDVMVTSVLSWSAVVASSGGSGWIVAMRIVDKDDEDPPVDCALFLYDSSVTPAAAADPHQLSDADAGKFIDVIETSDGTWQDQTDNHVITVRPSPWVHFHCSGGTTLYGILVSRGGQTKTATGYQLELAIIPD